MLTTEDEFERIVADIRPEAKMRPVDDPDPAPDKDKSGDSRGTEGTPAQDR